MIAFSSKTLKLLHEGTRAAVPLPTGVFPDGDGSFADDAPTLLTERKTQKPARYKVLMLNDDYTPMEFVVHVLQRFFGKSHEEATVIMLQVHHTGTGVCGVYTLEVAETKVAQVMAFGRRHQHPLQCALEKE